MSRTIYIVGGYYSDYDVHNDWNVLAFTDPEKANAYMLKCETRAKELVDQAKGEAFLAQFEIYKQNEFDPQMQVRDDQLPTYYVTAVTLED